MKFNKRFVLGLLALAMAGCGGGGVEFNGRADHKQYDVRRTPIIHYNLPSEVIDPVTGVPVLDISGWLAIDLKFEDFPERSSPGHDLWAQGMDPANPNGPWRQTHDVYKTSGAGWPSPLVNTQHRPACEYIAAWTLSIQNQWFLRDIDGAEISPPAVGMAPVRYEGYDFASMKISIHEAGSAASPFSQLLLANPATPAQQEVGDPATVGLNNVQRVAAPCNNLLAWNGIVSAPQGLLGACWREAPGVNKHIETNLGMMVGVPAPDYFGGGGPIQCTGGVYMRRFVDNWVQTTSGTASTINLNDGVTYSYYLASIGTHLMGWGLGLKDSSFAVPSAITDEEHLMNTSVVFDLTAFIALGKRFQFLSNDLLKLQDVANGTYLAPGPNSTLPGTGR